MKSAVANYLSEVYGEMCGAPWATFSEGRQTLSWWFGKKKLKVFFQGDEEVLRVLGPKLGSGSPRLLLEEVVSPSSEDIDRVHALLIG